MNVKGKLTLFSILLFLVGGSLGFIGWFLYHKQKIHRMLTRMAKTGPKTMQLDYFTKELGLTPEQRSGVDAILEKQFQGFKAIMEETKPRYDALCDSSRVAIVSLLTPEQKIKYDSLLTRWKRQIEKWKPKK